MRLMPLAYAPAVTLVNRLLADRVVTRIWDGDPTVWQAAPGSADERSIQTRLGWLHVAPTIRDGVPRAAALARDVVSEQYTTAYLLGMGGSSLCAEVLRDVAAAPDALRLTVIDTTDERTVHQVTTALDPARSLFVVASKSGSTIEVSSLERHFASVMTAAVGQRAGQRQQVERTERVVKSLWRERHGARTGWSEQYRRLETQSEHIRRAALVVLEKLLA